MAAHEGGAASRLQRADGEPERGVVTYGPLDNEGVYCGFWRRSFAFLIDCVILSVAGYGLSFLFSPGAASFIGVLFLVGYFAAFEASPWQATPGKKILGIQVADLDQERLGWKRALARNALKTVSAGSALGGFVIAAWTPMQQAIHDLMASTIVIRDPPTRVK